MKAVNDGDPAGAALQVYTLGEDVTYVTHDGSTVKTFASSGEDRVLELEGDQVVFMRAGTDPTDPTSSNGTKLLANTPTRYGLLAGHKLKFIGDTNAGYLRISVGGRRS